MSTSTTRGRIMTLLCNDFGIRITTNWGLVLEASDPLDVVVRPRSVLVGSNAAVAYESIVKVEALS